MHNHRQSDVSHRSTLWWLEIVALESSNSNGSWKPEVAHELVFRRIESAAATIRNA